MFYRIYKNISHELFSLRYFVFVIGLLSSVVLSFTELYFVAFIMFLYSIVMISECAIKVPEKFQAIFDVFGMFIWAYVFLILPLGWVFIVPLCMSFWLLVDPTLHFEV